MSDYKRGYRAECNLIIDPVDNYLEHKEEIEKVITAFTTQDIHKQVNQIFYTSSSYGKENNIMKQTKIISAFPACGKTYAFEKLNNEGYTVLDSDSSQFSWCYDYNPVESDRVERYRNPDFPKNYIQHIKENIGKVDYIFVSSHKEVRDALIDNDIYFTLVYPGRKMKAEWIGRCFLRGSGEKFCQLIADNWDKWIDEMEEIDDCDKWILGEDDSIDPDDLDRYYYLCDLIENHLI